LIAVSNPTVAIPGFDRGTTIENKLRSSPQPSMLAASIRASGILVLKNVRKMIIWNGDIKSGTITAQTVSPKPSRFLTTITNGTRPPLNIIVKSIKNVKNLRRGYSLLYKPYAYIIEIKSERKVPTTVIKMLLKKLLHSWSPRRKAASKLTVENPAGKNEYPIVRRLSELVNAIMITNMKGMIQASENPPIST